MFQYTDETEAFIFTWCVNCNRCGHWKSYLCAGHDYILQHISTEEIC